MSERGSSEHSPRVDEELKHETESLVRSTHEARADESRMAEPPADGEPLADAHVSVDDFELRSLLATSLRPGAFPGDRAVLLEVARAEYADAQVVALLERLPEARVFVNVEAVWEALGGQREQRQQPQPQPRRAPRVPEPAREPLAPPAQPSSEPQPQPQPQFSFLAFVFGLFAAGVQILMNALRDAINRVRRFV